MVKGGRRFSFAAMVVVGDGKGKVGWGYGKANEVPPSVEKAVKEGMRSMVDVPLDGGTIPHTVEGQLRRGPRGAGAGRARHGRDRRRRRCGPSAKRPASTTSSPRASARTIRSSLVKATIAALAATAAAGKTSSGCEE